MTAMRYSSASIWILVACASSPAPPVEPCGTVRWGPVHAPTWVSVGAGEQVAVFVEGADVPVAGAMRRREGQFAFVPVFPLEAGVRYRVRSAFGCNATFEVASRAGPAQRGRPVAIYPTAAELPENILRFYIYFGQPMAEGNYLDHVRLTHVGSGEEITGVFFDNIYELWSNDRKRITLLVDPGRVKTGLGAHERRGRAFVAGQTYELYIEASWPTITGQPMRQGLSKVFRATSEDRQAVQPRRWRLRLPTAGTRQPLWVDFGEPVDHVSVGRMVAVVGPGGEPLAGRWRLEPGEMRAAWTPRRAWSSPVESHQIVVNGRFEDIAGNNVNGAFDHRVGSLSEGREDRRLTIPFAGFDGVKRVDE